MVLSLFVQMTVSPTFACAGLGAYASLVLVEAPEVMSTFTSAAKAEWGIANTEAMTAANPAATAIFVFIEYTH